MGVSPEALRQLRAWLDAEPGEGTEAPLVEIEDLLAAVSEETPLLVQVERGEWMDGESLRGLSLVYRAGFQRHHLIVITTSANRKARNRDTTPDSFGRVNLHPLTQAQTSEIVRSYAEAEQPRATEDQLACAISFAEGIAMYGIEMLGLLLDVGSPDALPFRVRLAVDRALAELEEIHWRILALCRLLGDVARTAVIAATLKTRPSSLTSALDELELAGHLCCENGALRPSALLASGCQSRVAATVLREDSLRAAEYIKTTIGITSPAELYACIRLLIASNEETAATDVVNANVAKLLRGDTAENVSAHCHLMSTTATSRMLKTLLADIGEQVKSGAESWSPSRREIQLRDAPTALPAISPGTGRMEHKYACRSDLTAVMLRARDPNLPPSARLAEASMALILASNLTDTIALHAAQTIVQSVRHAPNVSAFDVARADMIFFASVGDSSKALSAAQQLVIESRRVADVQLACRGFRNAAEVFSTSGATDSSQALLLESRGLALTLGYHAQVAWADIGLAREAIYGMDLDAANTYLHSAQEIAAHHHIVAPLLDCDINLFRSWRAVMLGDIGAAQRAARVVVRRTAKSTSGTAHWAALSVKLATHRGKVSKEVYRDFASLRASIGSRPHYADEPLSLAALLLCSAIHKMEPNIEHFVINELQRMETKGRSPWLFLLKLLGRTKLESPYQIDVL